MISVESFRQPAAESSPALPERAEIAGNDFDVAARVEHRQRAADRLVPAALLVDLVAAQDVEVLVLRTAAD